jgi:hypothetical protein
LLLVRTNGSKCGVSGLQLQDTPHFFFGGVPLPHPKANP